MKYPKELFSIREDMTERNRRSYDERSQKMWNAIYADHADFGNLSLREQHEIVKNYRKEYWL